MDETHDAIVIGAGLSGLFAARRLRDAGRRVLVLEARERVGGRTYSQPLGSDVIDLGGQWVGPAHRRVHRLIDEFGIATFAQHHEGGKRLEFGGEVRTYRGTIPSLAPHALADLQIGIWRLEAMARRIPHAAPWRAKGAEALDRRTVEDWKRRNLVTSGARAMLDAATRAIFAAEPEEISFLHFLFYLRSGGGLMKLANIEDGAQERRVLGGTQQLSERMAEPLGESLRLGQGVRAIESDERGVTVHTERGSHRATRVILALAPKLLEGIEIANLPAKRAALARRMPMGSAIKCVLAYERPFWRERGLSGEAISHEGAIQLVFDDSAHDGSQAALVCFFLGRSARAHSGLGAEARRPIVEAALARLFGPEAANPTHYMDQDWIAEKESGGCYVGLMGPGVMTELGSALRTPAGRLHWAGTETAVEHCGYFEGALEAGERAASEVLTTG